MTIRSLYNNVKGLERKGLVANVERYIVDDRKRTLWNGDTGLLVKTYRKQTYIGGFEITFHDGTILSIIWHDGAYGNRERWASKMVETWDRTRQNDPLSWQSIPSVWDTIKAKVAVT